MGPARDSGGGVDPRIPALVPHRPPILRLRRVVAAGGAEAIAEGLEPAAADPDRLPWELGAIEGLAQTAAVMHGSAAGPAPPADGAAPAGMLVGVRHLVFHATPAPGSTIRYAVELVRRIGPAALVRGRAECDGVLLAEGELKLWNAEPGGGAP